MTPAKTGYNERTLSARIAGYANEYLSSANLGLTHAGAEETVFGKPGDRNALFLDVSLRNTSGSVVSFVEVKRPLRDPSGLSPRDPELLANAAKKAKRLGCRFFLTANGDEFVLWQAPRGRRPVQARDAQKSYWADLGSLSHLDNPVKIAGLRAALQEVLDDLDSRLIGRDIYRRPLDKTFFVGLLRETVRRFGEIVLKVALHDRRRDAKFRTELAAWHKRQGFEGRSLDDMLPLVASQIAHRIVTKIVFYQVLRQHFPRDLSDLPSDGNFERLEECFAAARQIDYEPIFGSRHDGERDLIDKILPPGKDSLELGDMIQKLHAYDFGKLREDIIGSVFEELIPESEKHQWGQYYTNERLVDLIEAFCVRDRKDKVLDPACGTGTFLVRAYAKLWMLNMSAGGRGVHPRLLSQLWGFDLAPFAAELAVINLARQNLRDLSSYPRVLVKDFFEVQTGTVFRFPPPHRKQWKAREEVAVPAFDAIVGNPPYIAQEIIEAADPHFKQKLAECLQDDWGKEEFGGYNGERLAFYPGQADIYAAFFIHAAAFLREGGRLGFVSSNAWLNARYGRALQEFLLRHFKLVAVLESFIEPWFIHAKVTPVVTVLERCSNEKARRDHLVKFVKVQKRLADILPGAGPRDDQRIWEDADGIADAIEGVGTERVRDSDGRFTVRAVLQGLLAEEIREAPAGQVVKWGPHLRAPAIYHRLRAEHADKFARLESIADVDYGVKPGIVDYFVLDPETIAHWKIEPEYCLPVVTTLRELGKPVIHARDLGKRLFVCALSKAELRRAGHTGALAYIAHGEACRTKPRGRLGTTGVPYPKVQSVRGRKHWHSVPVGGPFDVVVNQFMGRRYFFPVNRSRALATSVFFQVRFHERAFAALNSALVNSAACYLAAEVTGRTQAVGHTNFYGPEIKALAVPRAELVPAKEREKILALFNRLCARTFLPVHEEIRQADRRAFDVAVLHALGLPDPEETVREIHEGLAALAAEKAAYRDALPKQQEEIVRKDTAAAIAAVFNNLIPTAPKRFPSAFVAPENLGKKGVPLPMDGLDLAPFMDKAEIRDAKGHVHWRGHQDEGLYLYYAWHNGERNVSLPKDSRITARAVQEYEGYLRDLRGKLELRMREFIFEEYAAQAAVEKGWREHQLPDVL